MKEIKREIYLSGKLEVKRSEDEGKESRVIKGRAIVFNAPTTLWEESKKIYREEIAPEAVTQKLLDSSDIVMTMHHNPEKILARSKFGKGTLSYKLTEEGVDFEFEAPHTADGDTALELVRTGDIDGCSFWAYLKEDMMEITHSEENGKKVITSRIKEFATIRDFTLTPTPQYEQTEVQAALRARMDSKDITEDYSSKWEEIESIANKTT